MDEIIKDPMAYNDIRLCGITETQLEEYEERRIDKQD